MEQRRQIGFVRDVHRRATVRPTRSSVPMAIKSHANGTTPSLTSSSLLIVTPVVKKVRTRKPHSVAAKQHIAKTPVADIRVKPHFKKKPRLVQPKQINDVVQPAHKLTQSKKTLQPLRPAQPLF